MAVFGKGGPSPTFMEQGYRLSTSWHLSLFIGHLDLFLLKIRNVYKNDLYGFEGMPLLNVFQIKLASCRFYH